MTAFLHHLNDGVLCPTELGVEKVKHMEPHKIRPIGFHDFTESLKRVRHSVSTPTLEAYEKWNREYGDVSL